MLRPITQRWGICFRSTQRYTVCGLHSKKLCRLFHSHWKFTVGIARLRSAGIGHKRKRYILAGSHRRLPALTPPLAAVAMPEFATRAKHRAKQQIQQNRCVIIGAGAIVTALLICCCLHATSRRARWGENLRCSP